MCAWVCQSEGGREREKGRGRGDPAGASRSPDPAALGPRGGPPGGGPLPLREPQLQDAPLPEEVEQVDGAEELKELVRELAEERGKEEDGQDEREEGRVVREVLAPSLSVLPAVPTPPARPPLLAGAAPTRAALRPPRLPSSRPRTAPAGLKRS